MGAKLPPVGIFLHVFHDLHGTKCGVVTTIYIVNFGDHLNGFSPDRADTNTDTANIHITQLKSFTHIAVVSIAFGFIYNPISF